MHNWRKSIHQNGLHEFINWVQVAQKSSNVFCLIDLKIWHVPNHLEENSSTETTREMHLMIYFARIKSINDSLSRRQQIMVDII